MAVPSPNLYANGIGAVSGDNFNSDTQTVFNLAQLRTFTGVTNMAVLLLGFVAPNDGGQAFYVYLAGGPYVDNDTTVIVPYGALTGAWLRLMPLTGVSTGPSRIVTASVATSLLTSDYRVGFLRSVGLAAFTAQLPTANVSQEFILQDLSGNFNVYPVTVLPPAGTTFSANRASYVMNENNQTTRFAFYGQNVWGVESA